MTEGQTLCQKHDKGSDPLSYYYAARSIVTSPEVV